MNVTAGRADVLVDADNISSLRESVAKAVFRHAHADGFAVSAVHVVGRSPSVLRDYVNAFRALAPTACITEDHAPPGRNSGDVLVALWLGSVSRQLPEDPAPYRMYVLSRDNLVLATARRALGKRELVVPEDVSLRSVELLRLRTLPLPTPRRQDSKDALSPAIPAWAIEANDGQNCVGLDWVASAVTSPIDTPNFVPFPARLSSVSIGNAAGGHVDIDLSAWDGPPPRRSLYSPHVIFEYVPAPLSSWTLRSTHGHRSGKRKTALNGRLITAANGPEIVHAGSAIDIGRFSFRFRDNTFLNHAWFEDSKGMIERLERGFRALAENVPPSCLPEKVRLELSSGTRVLWEHAFIRHYEQLFAHILHKSIVNWVDTAFQSKTEIRRHMGSLNRIRNILFHPSRGAITDEDRNKLADLYLQFRSSAGWPMDLPT